MKRCDSRAATWTASRYSMTVDWSIGHEIFTNYDDASRVTSIVTNGGETTVAYGYDAANRKVLEDQNLAGYPTRRVETPVDGDGNRTSLRVGVEYQIRYEYTQRNQLAHIFGGSWEPWFNYSYDAAGNMIKRQAVLGGANDSINVPTEWYDPLNRPIGWENTKAGDASFSRSHYQYDNTGRETATWRDENNGSGPNRGEKFWYTPTGQLSEAKYDAEQVWTGIPANADRSVSYNYTPDMLNRSSVNDNGAVTNYGTSALNQYTAENNVTVYYDANFNISMRGGWFYYYDAQNRLTTVRDYTGALVLQNTYDGLGRCVKRDRRDWGTFVELITYDGWKPTVEWDGVGNFKAWNVYGPGADEILWRYENGIGHLRYHHDKQGSVTALLDWSGNVIEKYSYDAFGLPRVVDGWDTNWQYPRTWSSYNNRFMFTGREYFPGLWLYDYRHRMYQPTLGRFLQVDPLGLQTEGVKLSADQKALFSPGGGAPEAFTSSEINLYRYCGDDPINGSDAMGLNALFMVGANRKDPTYFTRIAEKWAQKYEQSHKGQTASVVQVRTKEDVNTALKDHKNLDRLDYLGHASGTSLILTDRTFLHSFDVASLPKDNVKPGASIMLSGCNTGGIKGSVAEAFANRFSQTVIGVKGGISFGIPVVNRMTHATDSIPRSQGTLAGVPYIFVSPTESD